MVSKPPGPGRVYIVGAGPGDPGLLTLRALELLKEADVVVYDRLVGEGVLALIPQDKELIGVGRAPGSPSPSCEEIMDVVIGLARKGKTVVRLKGGDPHVFGRGGEIAFDLSRAGIPFEVVPGVTSATAVPAYAGIPVTHRDLSSVVVIATGHEGEGKEGAAVDWSSVARIRGTIVILMGVGQMEGILHQLQEGGMDAATPAAVVERGTLPDQRVVRGTLGDLARRAKEAEVGSPAVVVVGSVVALADELGGRN